MRSQDLSVALIGMPAVGKSTVGVLLAKQLGYDFLDTDIVIHRLLNSDPKGITTWTKCLPRDRWQNILM